MMHWPTLVALLLVHTTYARHHHLHESKNIERYTVVDSATGIVYNPYSKHHPGRHVCTKENDIVQPVKTTQAICKPIYKQYLQKCNDNQLCSAIKVIYETAYKDVVTTKQSKQIAYFCCPGWKQATNRSYGCNKPLCNNECQNGGMCIKPDLCSCNKGFTGRSCDIDVNECEEQKPCDHICINTPGSYTCQCKENFNLQSDGQSCKKEDDDPGFEAKELQFESLDERVHTLELMLNDSKNNEMKKDLKEIKTDIQFINKDILNLRHKLSDIESYKKDFNIFQTKLYQIEKKSVKIDELSAKYDKMKKCAFYNKICI